MRDRCYMTVTCKRKDKKVFEDMDFHTVEPADDIDDPDPEDTIEMVDEEANYAHWGKMPKNLVYYGHHYEGEVYNAQDFACDGSKYMEVRTGIHGDYVIRFDADGNPSQADLDKVKEYLALEKRVVAELNPNENLSH